LFFLWLSCTAGSTGTGTTLSIFGNPITRATGRFYSSAMLCVEQRSPLAAAVITASTSAPGCAASTITMMPTTADKVHTRYGQKTKNCTAVSPARPSHLHPPAGRSGKTAAATARAHVWGLGGADTFRQARVPAQAQRTWKRTPRRRRFYDVSHDPSQRRTHGALHVGPRQLNMSWWRHMACPPSQAHVSATKLAPLQT